MFLDILCFTTACDMHELLRATTGGKDCARVCKQPQDDMHALGRAGAHWRVAGTFNEGQTKRNTHKMSSITRMATLLECEL